MAKSTYPFQLRSRSILQRWTLARRRTSEKYQHQKSNIALLGDDIERPRMKLKQLTAITTTIGAAIQGPMTLMGHQSFSPPMAMGAGKIGTPDIIKIENRAA